MSRIDQKKNLEGVLQALRLVLAKNLKVTLSIAGSGDPQYVKSLRLLARDLAIDNHINWLGYVEGEKKNEALTAASAFVLPSYSENFGHPRYRGIGGGTSVPCFAWCCNLRKHRECRRGHRDRYLSHGYCRGYREASEQRKWNIRDVEGRPGARL